MGFPRESKICERGGLVSKARQYLAHGRVAADAPVRQVRRGDGGRVGQQNRVEIFRLDTGAEERTWRAKTLVIAILERGREERGGGSKGRGGGWRRRDGREAARAATTHCHCRRSVTIVRSPRKSDADRDYARSLRAETQPDHAGPTSPEAVLVGARRARRPRHRLSAAPAPVPEAKRSCIVFAEGCSPLGIRRRAYRPSLPATGVSRSTTDIRRSRWPS